MDSSENPSLRSIPQHLTLTLTRKESQDPVVLIEGTARGTRNRSDFPTSPPWLQDPLCPSSFCRKQYLRIISGAQTNEGVRKKGGGRKETMRKKSN